MGRDKKSRTGGVGARRVIFVTDIEREDILCRLRASIADRARNGGGVQIGVIFENVKIRRIAVITITGTVGAAGKYLVTSIPINTKVDAVLKISFENNTSGTNLALIAGTSAQFASGTGGTQISDSGGPGFQFLTITDTATLSGLALFVRRVVGSAASNFTLVLD